jgi:hypothetical protein
MYLRVDKVDAVAEPLKALQENIQICLEELRRLSSTALPEIQSVVGQRIADCEEKIGRLLASTNERSVQISHRDQAAPGGVSADDIIASIEMILGRTPDQALVDYHLKLGFADRFALGKYMISTDEFRAQFHGSMRNHTNHDPTKWQERARQALDRKSRLLSFGPNARGLLVTTKHGLFSVDPEDSGVSTILLHEGCYAEPEYILAKSLISKKKVTC